MFTSKKAQYLNKDFMAELIMNVNSEYTDSVETELIIYG